MNIKRLIIVFFLLFSILPSLIAQQKWKQFKSENADYSLELPSNFDEGAIVAGGMIVYYTDTNLSEISIWVESGSDEYPIDSIFQQHKENFSFVSRELLRKDYFILMGEENSFDKYYLYEKCLFKKGFPYTLRIFYPESHKRYMETLIPKIGANFK